VLPGGNTHLPLSDGRVIAWIHKAAPDAEVVMSVCTGAFLLAKAGLLDGKEATPWAAVAAYGRFFWGGSGATACSNC
jgi:transcriptional regulator GlxA family with amidase domain